MADIFLLLLVLLSLTPPFTILREPDFTILASFLSCKEHFRPLTLRGPKFYIQKKRENGYLQRRESDPDPSLKERRV